ncbi:RND superfamily putative drug exporter [Actinocorallia herbida]|uniref:RND superfamily putative drug exporter n=1 Tax=Actinocorallia herbida TaxID=58109 RepID=A0A3N1CWB3_9ACTN|nr:MMPL family transporter [Actinocorallia herbida]ROO85580.1 RND superfamily putative drug exporter [Actinocorallia herbida]
METEHLTPGGFFARLGGWAQRRRWPALLLWLVTVAAVTVGAQAAGGAWQNDHSLPGTDSQAALELMEEHGAAQAGAAVQIVFQDPSGVAEAAVAPLLTGVRALPHVAAVGELTSSRDGTIGYATVTLDAQATHVPKEDVREIIDTAHAAATGDLRVELGGEAVAGAEEAEGGAAEGAGLLAALVILVLLFGSLAAAAVPLVIAVFAVGGAVGLITLASHAFTVADFTPPVMMLVGLGVGVDYALLIFARFRQELTEGREAPDAIRAALDAAGRTVFFAGCTVIIAMLGLVVLGLGSLQGVALAVALTVLVTMAASLTLLPALLAFFGERVRGQVLRRHAKATAKGKREGARWYAFAGAVQKRPGPILVVAVAALAALSAPALDLRLGFADEGTRAPATTSRQAYDLMAEGFGPGFAGPLAVVVEGDAAAAERLRTVLAGTDGIAATTPALPSGDGSVSTVLAFPETAPQDAETAELVDALRDDVLPALGAETGAGYLVGGPTAAARDFAGAVADRMPLFVAVVVGLSALLLMLVFRSLLIPLKAAALNLLSVSAALGVIVLVFQHGLLGAQPGPVEAFVPVMIFAIVFGLSMDYEVFLVSRVHEEWERTGDHALAVRAGLAATGRVITAAAAIMIVVFGAFLLSPDRMLQQFGLGLATAILLDALVIRCLIVPAALQLFGARAWWLPRPLAARLPRLALEKPST